MTPNFAKAIDPVFLYVLDLLDRIGNDEEPSPKAERVRIRALLDRAEAALGRTDQWELAKYALVSWIDELLVDAPWAGGEWWSNNVLEMEFFKTRSCNELFFEKAQQAATLPQRDALEVYYVCVVLGFRGLYGDAQLAEIMIESMGLPDKLETWAEQTVLSIRLGQGRPELAPPSAEVAGAPPLRARGAVVWSWLTASMLAITAVICYVLFGSPW